MKRKQRHKRIRAKVKGIAERPRLCVFRSNQHIYVQLINDTKGETLVAASDLELKSESKTKTDLSLKVGKQIAEKAQAEGINKVVFDRGGYKYHGRVKAVAEGARQGGLKF